MKKIVSASDNFDAPKAEPAATPKVEMKVERTNPAPAAQPKKKDNTALIMVIILVVIIIATIMIINYYKNKKKNALPVSTENKLIDGK